MIYTVSILELKFYYSTIILYSLLNICIYTVLSLNKSALRTKTIATFALILEK